MSLYPSSVQLVHKKRKREKFWNELFEEIESSNGSVIAVSNSHPEIQYKTLCRRYKKYKLGHQYSNSTQQGFHRKIFSEQEEIYLAAIIRSEIDAHYQPVDCQYILANAIKYYNQLHIHNLRKFPYPSFSSHWIANFVARHSLSIKKLHIKETVKSIIPADQFNQLITYSLEVIEAVRKYGGDLVINMDETPVKCVDSPGKAYGIKGDKGKLCVSTQVRMKANVTIMPAITRSGKKLRFSWIKKGKTLKCLQKLKLPCRINSYYSQSGWVNSGIIIKWIEEIIKPYIKGRSAALILDDYGAHWDSTVIEKAEQLNIQLIAVPKGATAVAQPLDIYINGRMKQDRQIQWLNEHFMGDPQVDSVQNAVIRALKAYENITAQLIQKAFETIV